MWTAVNFIFILQMLMLFETYEYSNNDSLELSTLTTAKLRITSPKPTTQFRRINIERKLNDDVTSEFDFLKIVRTKGKKGRNSSDVWKWDYWCQLQPKKGSCEKSLKRFYYDTQLDKCLPFLYSGCNSNKNNFNTLADCTRYCDGTTFIRLEDSSESKFCSLQPNTGFCLALYKRYYYDINEMECKEFIYGGCAGNQNKFETLHSCILKCRGATNE